MAFYFLDSSGLAKRYVAEVGSEWIQDLVNPTTGNQVYVAQVTGVEVVAAITRRQRQGSSSAAEAAAAIADFRADFAAAYYIIDISPTLVNHAMDMAEKHALRGYDAVQLAACLYLRDRCRILVLPDPIMVSVDMELNAAESAEGLAVDDPNSHS